MGCEGVEWIHMTNGQCWTVVNTVAFSNSGGAS